MIQTVKIKHNSRLLIVALSIIGLYLSLVQLNILLPPNIRLETELPEQRKSLPSISIKQPYELIITSTTANDAARELGGFQYITQGLGGEDEYIAYFGLHRFEVNHRLNHIKLELPLDVHQSADGLMDEVCRHMSDVLVAKVIDYYPDSEVSIDFNRVDDITSDDDEEVILKRVHYDLRVDGAIVLGDHATFFVDVCESGVKRFEVDYNKSRASNSILINPLFMGSIFFHSYASDI